LRRASPSLLPFWISLLPFALLVWRFDFVCDDAFISFRYARNLADGFGLTYNVGPEPPVEGYSEFLWVLWLALLESLRLDVTVGARVASVACGVGLLLYGIRLVERRLDLPIPWVTACGLFLATLPPLAVWTTGGLATVPFTLVVFAAFERLLGDPERPHGLQSGLLALLAVLLRVDAGVWVALILGIAAATSLYRRDAALARATGTAALAVASGSVLYLLWRYGYYGDLVPMTAHAKGVLSGTVLRRGVYYLLSSILTVPSIGLVFLLAPLCLGGAQRDLGIQSWLMATGTFAYCVLVGGDFMSMGRFLLPALPFLALLFGILLRAVIGEGSRRPALGVATTGAALALALLPAFDLHVVPEPLRRALHFRWNTERFTSEYRHWLGMKRRAERWSLLGKALKAHSEPGDSLVSPAIGAVGYYSGLFIYDRQGLVTREVGLRRASGAARRSAGHDKSVPPTFFRSHRPTYLRAHLAASPRERDALLRQLEGLSGHGYRAEAIALSASEGFPDGFALVVLRRPGRVEKEETPPGE
jgi:hypothetical protein